MSIAPIAYRYPRSEVEVAASVVAQLLEARVLERDPASLAAAAEKVGVSVSDVRKAWYGIQDWGYRRPTARSTATTEAPPPKTPRRPRQKRSLTGVPDSKRCSRCKLVKPIDEFAPRTDQNGRKPWCDDCRRAYQRERYLTVEARDKVNAVLRFLVQEGDECVGGLCPRCSRPFAIGDELATDAVALHHAVCGAS